MRLSLCIVFFFISGLTTEAQISVLDSSSLKDLLFYDVVFLGERHDIESTEYIESKIIKTFKSENSTVFIEAPYDLNYPYDFIFKKRDTVAFTFYNVGYLGKRMNLLRDLYLLGFDVKAIDVFQKRFFLKEQIKKIRAEKILPDTLNAELDEYLKIGYYKFPYEVKDMTNSFNFLERFNKNRSLYANYLAKDSLWFFEYFGAFQAFVYSKYYWDSPNEHISKYREEFMLRMVVSQISGNPAKKLICINGCDHISLDSLDLRKKSRVEKTFVPLVTTLKNKFPNKKIASVYLLNVSEGNYQYFYKEHKDEWMYILKNLDLEKNYIIKLDYENSPFRALLSKYTHIVVYN
jgi:hypothetical protein